ncbi:MAG: diphthine--ammonia ligase [Firmicutes bacterium]|nr:diphthine--ammonia ligase [Bacillota bacterium]
MKFVMSYSCGKDSTIALHKMIEQGNEPVALLIMVNEKVDRSFFHGADYIMLKAYSKALDLPLLITPSEGENYHIAMEESLREARKLGAEVACFGDIDIEGNRKWAEERCKNADIEAVFPLWHRNREENVYELIDRGYKCLIKSINSTLIPKALLGKYIDEAAIEEMRRCGIDICGENGEYHTLVVDGPIFKNSLPYKTGEVMDFGDFSIIDVYMR